MLGLDALVDKKREFGGVRELAAIGTQKLVKLSAGIGDALVWNIHRVHDNDDVNGSLAAAESMERCDAPWSFVVKNGEVLLLEIGDGRPRLRRHHDIERDAGCRGCRRRHLLLGRESDGANHRDKENKSKRLADDHEFPSIEGPAPTRDPLPKSRTWNPATGCRLISRRSRSLPGFRDSWMCGKGGVEEVDEARNTSLGRATLAAGGSSLRQSLFFLHGAGQHGYSVAFPVLGLGIKGQFQCVGRLHIPQRALNGPGAGLRLVDRILCLA